VVGCRRRASSRPAPRTSCRVCRPCGRRQSASRGLHWTCRCGSRGSGAEARLHLVRSRHARRDLQRLNVNYVVKDVRASTCSHRRARGDGCGARGCLKYHVTIRSALRHRCRWRRVTVDASVSRRTRRRSRHTLLHLLLGKSLDSGLPAARRTAPRGPRRGRRAGEVEVQDDRSREIEALTGQGVRLWWRCAEGPMRARRAGRSE